MSPSGYPFVSSSSGTANFVVYDDQSGAIEYAGDWVQEAYPSNVAYNGTVTVGLHANASATYAFTIPNDDGMFLAVSGIILPLNSTTSDPDAQLPVSSYSLDSAYPALYRPPANTTDAQNAEFYSSPPLPPGEHALVITVLKASATYPFMLDFLIVGAESLDDVPTGKKLDVGTVVGATVGGVALLVAMGIIGVLWWLMRGKRVRFRRLEGVEQEETPYGFTPYTMTENSSQRSLIPVNAHGKRVLERPESAGSVSFWMPSSPQSARAVSVSARRLSDGDIGVRMRPLQGHARADSAPTMTTDAHNIQSLLVESPICIAHDCSQKFQNNFVQEYSSTKNSQHPDKLDLECVTEMTCSRVQ